MEKGRKLFFEETFGGNGRTCGTCHRVDGNLTLDAALIRRLPISDPLFVAETNPKLAGLENPALMRRLGLILENPDGFDRPGVLRSVPHTLALRQTTGPVQGGSLAGATGWSGDGAPKDGTLGQFAVGAVVQHFPKSLAREPNVDFRVPRQDELDALLAFQLSTGRQGNLVVDPRLTGALGFRDASVTAGQNLFHGIGTTRGCTACHTGAGSDNSQGFGVNTDTGVRLVGNAPACLDPAVPADGGFGKSNVLTVVLCGKETSAHGDGTFNSPSLIEAADTPPFFHNNSAATIEAAVKFYTSATFNASPAGAFGAFTLDPAQVNQVAAFLRALNALDNIANARRSLQSAIGRPGLLGLLRDPAVIDIRDAIRVLTTGPLQLFTGPRPTVPLLAAVTNMARGRIPQATVDLDRARSLIVGPAPAVTAP